MRRVGRRLPGGQIILFGLLPALLIGCVGPASEAPAASAADSAQAAAIPAPVAAAVAQPRPKPKSKAPTAPPAPNPEDVARAKQLMVRGQALYRKGDYDNAEKALKQAMTVYPFLAAANITLGKIFLIRGAASRDPALIDSARLMFEMARAQNGNGSREAEVLLELFRAVPE